MVHTGASGDLNQSLGWEDSLEEEMATHSSFSLKNPMDRGAWGLQSMNQKRARHDLVIQQ